MEEIVVEEMVEVMVVEMEGGVVGIGRPKEGARWLFGCCRLQETKKEKKK